MRLHHLPLALLALGAALAGCGEGGPLDPAPVPGAPAAGQPVTSGPAYERFVDARTGSDETGDGRSAGTAYRTVARALADIPSLVDRPWLVRLAPGRYAETVRIHRFSMPGILSYEQVIGPLDSVPLLAFEGDPLNPDSVVLEAPAGAPCLSLSGAAVFAAGFTCQARGSDGLVAAGGTLVLDDVRVRADTASRSGVSLDRGGLYLGGTVRVQGPFGLGLSVRNHGVARNQTHRNRTTTVLEIDGATQGIFLRDAGTVTLFGGADTLRISRADVAIHGSFHSTAFFATRVVVEVSDSRVGYWAAHQSGINSHTTRFQNVTGAALRCSKQSYVLIETGTWVNSTRSIDTDGTCEIRH